MRYPNLFIVGQPKAGSTSLAQQLSQHPDIFLPTIKEPHYMCRLEGRDWYYYNQPLIYDANIYNHLYAGATEKYCIDGSVHYLRFESAAHEIKKLVPDAKIIAIIREPVSRITSHYLMDLRGGFVKSELATILAGDDKYSREYIDSSMVYKQLNLYIELFGEMNVLPIDFAEYSNNGQVCLDRITHFLGVPAMQFAPVNANAFRMPKPYVRWLYSSYYARKIYGAVVPKWIKDSLRRFILDWKKPAVVLDVNSPAILKVKDDYSLVSKLMRH